MKIKEGQETDWAKFKEINSAGAYSNAVVQFAELWAEEMERRLEAGGTIADIAKDAMRVADSNIGITGFMYGCAVSALAKGWEHGEELRRWHNLDVQIGNEGERANESGGTLNPAILNIG